MSKSTAIIDDSGFSKLYTGGKSAATNGRSESANRDAQSQRPTERVAGFETVSPFDIADAGSDDGSTTGDGPSGGTGQGTETRRRGRPPGSKNKETVSKNLANLEDILFTIHLSLAGLTFEELQLDPSEAKAQADAYRELAKYYNFYIDPKKMAMINLAALLGKQYGMRAIAIYRRLQSEAKPKSPAPTPIRKEQPKPNAVPEYATGTGPQPAPQPKRSDTIAEVPSQVWPEGGEYIPPVD